ncbi:hypothetical protein [Kitasatospora cineracea]|uniref:hypothetical protein n=1 Tax=Kitasatospora cineracea TaxID=88074 RepID=UPI000F4E2464|nr:hypothetical protein [Kitasatospora cineracea]
MNTTALPTPRELLVGIALRLRLIAPVALIVWLCGIEVGVTARLVLVPLVLGLLALDVVAHHAPHSEEPAASRFRVHPGASTGRAT